MATLAGSKRVLLLVSSLLFVSVTSAFTPAQSNDNVKFVPVAKATEILQKAQTNSTNEGASLDKNYQITYPNLNASKQSNEIKFQFYDATNSLAANQEDITKPYIYAQKKQMSQQMTWFSDEETKDFAYVLLLITMWIVYRFLSQKDDENIASLNVNTEHALEPMTKSEDQFIYPAPSYIKWSVRKFSARRESRPTGYEKEKNQYDSYFYMTYYEPCPMEFTAQLFKLADSDEKTKANFEEETINNLP